MGWLKSIKLYWYRRWSCLKINNQLFRVASRWNKRTRSQRINNINNWIFRKKCYAIYDRLMESLIECLRPIKWSCNINLRLKIIIITEKKRIIIKTLIKIWINETGYRLCQ